MRVFCEFVYTLYKHSKKSATNKILPSKIVFLFKMGAILSILIQISKKVEVKGKHLEAHYSPLKLLL